MKTLIKNSSKIKLKKPDRKYRENKVWQIGKQKKKKEKEQGKWKEGTVKEIIKEHSLGQANMKTEGP